MERTVSTAHLAQLANLDLQALKVQAENPAHLAPTESPGETELMEYLENPSLAPLVLLVPPAHADLLDSEEIREPAVTEERQEPLVSTEMMDSAAPLGPLELLDQPAHPDRWVHQDNLGRKDSLAPLAPLV